MPSNACLLRNLVLVCAVLAVGAPHPGRAQGLLPTVAGAGAGLVVGGSVSLGVIAARTHLAGEYVDSYRDLFPLPAALVAGGLVSGIALGATDADALGRAGLAALLIGGAGAGMGALAGREFLDRDTGPWAGALMGAGVGALTGWVLGAALGGDAGGGRGAVVGVRVPVGPGGSRP